ncbi:hypothetical protein ACFV7R_45215 [Streptomyces sp. NPDC059866]|uniref:hypothetical protein n=1 Tax=Streptomyces sp. NPDC059866 TaxID=3346978 RepID=UPI00365E2854
MDPRRLRLVARLLSVGSIEEIAALAEQIPEVLTPEFELMIAELIQQALARGEPEMAVALADRADALQALRGAEPAEAGLFELLMRVPFADRVIELADVGDWNSWLIILREGPDLFGKAFLDYLDRCRPHVTEGEAYLLDVLAAFLSECADVGPDAAVSRWRSSAEVGEATELPAEFSLAALSHLVDRFGDQDDAVAAQALGNLGVLYYQRRAGDQGQNLERAESLLREAIEMADRHGATKPRAQAQQALMNVLLARDPQRNVKEALDLSLAALRGWEKHEDPEMWGLIMTSRANTLAELGRLEEAIDCYAASLTVFTRPASPKRWGISMFGLANAHVRRGRRDGNRADFETALTLHTEAAELRTREQDERRWAMTQESLGWCYLLRDRSAERREDVDLAVGHFNAALEYYVPGTVERPGIMHGLGRALLARHEETADQADLAASKAALQEALEGTAKIDRRDAHSALAAVHLRLAPADSSAHTAAVAHQSAALEFTSAENEPQRWADEAFLLARILLERGGTHQGEDHEKAISVLTKALALAEQPVSRARILEALGMAHTWRPFGHRDADARKAMKFYREALASFTKEKDATLWASVHYAMAASILEHAAPGGDDDQERLAEVLGLLEEAGAAIQPDDRRGITRIENLVGAAHLAYGNREDAIAPLARARAGYARLGLAEEFADAQRQLARAYGPADRRTVRAAITAQRIRPMTEYPFDFGKAAELLGHALLRQGEPERAGHAYRDAVRARRWAMSVVTLPTDRDLARRHFGGNIAEQACLCFARAAEHAGDDDGPRLLALAVESLDEGRMGGFPELETALADALARHDPGLLEEYRATAASLQSLMGMDRSTLTGSLIGPRASIPDVETWLRARDAAITARARYSAVLDRIRAATGLDMTVGPLSLQEISGLLGPDEALAYVLCDEGEGTDRQLLLLVLPDGTVQTHWSNPGSRPSSTSRSGCRTRVSASRSAATAS